MRLRLKVRHYDLEMLGERSREISYGELAHLALYFLEPLPPGYGRKELKKYVFKAVDRALSLADPRFRESFAEARDFLGKTLVRALLLEEVRPFFRAGVKYFNELEVHDSSGDLHRLDRLVLLGDGPVILEYKLGSRRKAHWEQLKLYRQILADILGTTPRAYLFYLEEPALVRLEDFSSLLL